MKSKFADVGMTKDKMGTRNSVKVMLVLKL